MTISDYFTFALTGERVGDAGTAAFVGLFDLQQRAWWPAALSAFEIEARSLSHPLPPGSACGRTTAAATELLGLPAAIPFAVGSLDHHVGAIGAGLGRVADVSITTGTVLAALALVDRVSAKCGCFYGAHVDGQRYYCLAFDLDGAGQLEDYQRQSAPECSVGELLVLAEEASGDSPSKHGIAVRRILEQIAQTHRELVRTVGAPDATGDILATGGGARSPLWLQIKADTLGRRLVTSLSPEPGCLGAAIFAAVAARQFPSIPEAQAAMSQCGAAFVPTPVGEEQA
jgi:xylulokinase